MTMPHLMNCQHLPDGRCEERAKRWPAPEVDSPKVYEIDCSAYGPDTGTSIVKILGENRVFKVEPSEKEGMFEITEMCDDYFSATLTAEQLEALGKELIAISKGQRP